jgi:hypothetical protein
MQASVSWWPLQWNRMVAWVRRTRLPEQDGDVAGGRGKMPKAKVIKSAYREVSCAMQKDIGLMYAYSTMNILRASGQHFIPVCDVHVQEEPLKQPAEDHRH